MEPRATAELPRACVRLLEPRLDLVEQPLHDLDGGVRRDLADEARVEEEPAHGEHHLAVDVVLEVLECLVPDAHRAVSVEAGEVLDLPLRRLVTSVDPVSGLERALALVRAVSQVLEEEEHLLRVAEPLERVQREVRVAEPAVPVVPRRPEPGCSARLVVVAASSAPVSSYWWSLRTRAERITSLW